MPHIRKQIPTTLLILVCAVTQAQSSDVDELLRQIVATQSGAYESVTDLTRVTKSMGRSTFEYYEKVPPFEVDGMMINTLRMVPLSEIQRRHNAANGINTPSATEMAQAADTIEMAGVAMEREMKSEMASSGLPGGLGSMLMNPPPDQPWLSANPRDMTSMYAMMLRAGAEGEGAMAAEKAGIPADYARSMREMRSKMRLQGNSEFNGRQVIDLIAEGLNVSQSSNGEDINCQSMQMKIDAEWKIPLYFKMNCAVSDGGKTKQISIERESSDVRTVPGCGAYREPFHSVMHIAGVMTPEQEKQLADAGAQLKELDAQMASMPPDQRAMMEKMVGPQLKMLRNMAKGEGIEFIQDTVWLRCNLGLPDPAEISQTIMGGATP